MGCPGGSEDRLNNGAGLRLSQPLRDRQDGVGEGGRGGRIAGPMNGIEDVHRYSYASAEKIVDFLRPACILVPRFCWFLVGG